MWVPCFFAASQHHLSDDVVERIEFSPVAGPHQHAPQLLPNIEFQDAAAAGRELVRLRQIVPDGVYQSFLALLSASPSPDATVNQFQRLAETASPEVLRLLDQHHFLVHYAVVIFGHSPWLGETLTQTPELLYGFSRERTFDRTHSREEFEETFARMRSRSFETDTAALLARFKRREYVRIALRDVLGIATLAETTAE